jgi:hypothetical protein
MCRTFLCCVMCACVIQGLKKFFISVLVATSCIINSRVQILDLAYTLHRHTQKTAFLDMVVTVAKQHSVFTKIVHWVSPTVKCCGVCKQDVMSHLPTSKQETLRCDQWHSNFVFNRNQVLFLTRSQATLTEGFLYST